jgi:DNA modification methylase
MEFVEKPEWGNLATYAPNRSEPVYNWLHYKEGFSRQLVTKLLDLFEAKEGQLVLDPFCGVGTTMLACRERGIDSVGFDAHPIAVFVSRVKLREYRKEDIIREMKKVLGTEFIEPKIKTTNNLLKRGFSKRALEEIVFYRDQIMQTRNKDTRDLLLLGLMNVATRCSWISKDGAVLKIKKRKGTPLPRKVIGSQFKKMLKDLDKIEFGKSRSGADFGDARRLGLADNVADFVITSPPYLNKREYENVFRVEQGLFLDMIGFRPYSNYLGSSAASLKELGKDSAGLLKVLGDDAGKLPKTALSYFMDMYQAIEEMYRVCRPGAKLAIVMGNGCFPTRVVESDVIMSRIAKEVGFIPKSVFVLNKRWCTKNRTKKVGILRESLLIWKK